MAKFIRYATAALFFAASVGCLALWWRSQTNFDWLEGPSYLASKRAICLVATGGQFHGRLWSETESLGQLSQWKYYSGELATVDDQPSLGNSDKFVAAAGVIHFPFWYASLVFALTGVSVQKFRRQFSIRSALIATTVAAALIGMAVIL